MTGSVAEDQALALGVLEIGSCALGFKGWLVRRGLGVLAGVIAGAMAAAVAHATPLDVTACDAATLEQGQMSDLPMVLERGPEWGKANLPQSELLRVARWIELQEQLSFRCGRGRVTAEAKRAAAAAELIENPPQPQAAEKPGAIPTVPASVAVLPEIAATAPPVVAGPEQPASQPATPKPKPRAKLKSKPKTVEAAPASDAAAVPAEPSEAPTPPAKKKRQPKPASDAYIAP